MTRLTKRNEDGTIDVQLDGCVTTVYKGHIWYEPFAKLSFYEETEEQGLLSYKSCSEEELSSETTCSTCKNNQEFPPPHTCDICNSLDEEFGCMYERRENDGE